MDVQQKVAGFMKDVLTAMGLSLDVHVNDLPDGIRIELSGEGGEVLLRRKGEALDALQQIVNTGFRRELDDDRSFVVDCMDYRKAKDAELQADGALHDGEGEARPAAAGDGAAEPLRAPPRPPDRRRGSAMSSESIGDAFLKTVIISTRR